MEIGYFYFIAPQFFKDFPIATLMHNHEAEFSQDHNRPCYYAIKGKGNINWLIPISSKVDKFKKLYADKVKKYGICDTIVFADVLGQERAFLIQNIFPVTDKYMLNQYIDGMNKPVMIDGVSKKEITKKAKKVLALQRKGKKLIFGNVLQIEKELLDSI